MFFTVKIKKICAYALIIMGTAALIISVFSFIPHTFKDTFSALDTSGTLVIDPGHGGVDGGAVSVSGIKESDINLSIALRLQKIAEFCGIKTAMTRVDDSIGQDIDSYSERDELIRRTNIANNVPGGVLISIHQNTFPTSQPSGSQVLYGSSKGSQSLGEITHNNLINYLNRENRRVAEPAPEELYITANTQCPVILVECGFISNFSDLEKLCDNAYNTAFAAVLAASYLQFKNSNI